MDLNIRPVIKKISGKEPQANLFSAFSFDDSLTLCLYIPASYSADSTMLELYIDDSMTRKSYKAEKIESTEDFDMFAHTLDFKEICQGDDSGLFYYHFSFESNGKRMFVSRNHGDLLPEIVLNDWDVSAYQLLIYKSDFKTPDDFKGCVMYQIFPDRFSRGSIPVKVRDDAVINEDWYGNITEYAEYPGAFVKNNTFFGGTLWGIIEKLDYLKSLGVDFIYLNPIFEAYSNHKYDTGNYMKVDEMFGGDEAFERLICEADKIGIKIILDGVFNHTGSDSIYFNKHGRYNTVGAYNSRESKYADWYFFDSFPDNYKSWWGIEILPKLNGKNPALVDYLCGEDGVIRHYLRKGVYGWRLDVADELDEELLARIRQAAKAENDALVIGEVWEDASNKVAYDRRRRYFRGNELDSVMNYPLKNAVIGYLKSKDASGIARITTELYMHYPKAVSDTLMNFLSTHDTERILTVLSGEDISEKNNCELSTYTASYNNYTRAKELLKIAYLIIATMPGVPCIYYGDEAGLEGARDPFNRKPYPWGREENTLIEWYKKIGKIRKKEKLFKDGYFKVTESQNSVFAYERFDENEKISIIINLSDNDYETKTDGISLLCKGSDVHTVKPFDMQIIKTQL